MKKEQKDTKSLEKYFGAIVQVIALSENGVLSRKEIEKLMIENKICESRLVSNILKTMIEKEYLIHQKIKGQKRQGYATNEEIIGKMNESYFTSSVTKKGFPKYTKITQKELTIGIKRTIREYKTEFANKKSRLWKDDMFLLATHYNGLAFCVSWISRLTLSIHGGVFGDKVMKITNARANILLLENFMNILLNNVREKKPDGYDMFLTGFHNYLEFLDPLENTEYSRKVN